MKTVLSFLLLFIFIQTSFSQTDSLTKIKIATDLESLSLINSNDTANYIIGMIFSKQLETLPELITIDNAILLKGFLAAQKEQTIFSFEDANLLLRNMIEPPQEATEEVAEAVEAVEDAQDNVEVAVDIRPKSNMSPEEMVFFVKNGKREGVITTPTGMQYELVVGSGRGTSPTLRDRIDFFYFAEYQKDGETVKLQKDGYINIKYQDEEWQEIYQLLKIGNTYRFYLPTEYSKNAPAILANEGEMIIVDIELMRIR